MRFTQVLFDLDGTLTESGRGIISSVRFVLEEMQYAPLTPEQLRSFVGPPLNVSFEKHCGMKPEETARAIEVFRDHYRKRGILDSPAYPGIKEALSALRDAGCTLCVATAKPQDMAERVLELQGLTGFFSFVSASRPEWELISKGENDVKIRVIGETLEQLPDHDPAKTVMVGDRRFDIESARACNIPGIGASYGYGSREELTNAGASALAETPQEMTELILRM